MNKVVSKEEFHNKIKLQLKFDNNGHESQMIVLCHYYFDQIHPGHL